MKKNILMLGSVLLIGFLSHPVRSWDLVCSCVVVTESICLVISKYVEVCERSTVFWLPKSLDLKVYKDPKGFADIALPLEDT